MTMIVINFGTNVSLKNLGLSLGEVHCSPWKLTFPLRTIMSPRKRSLSFPRDQLKLFFPQGTITYPKEKEHFSLGNLGLSPKKIHCSLRKLYFSPRNFSYSIGNLFGIGIQSYFAQGKYFLWATNLKIYLYVLWIFSSILFVEKNNWEKD